MFIIGPKKPSYTVAMHDEKGVINVKHWTDIDKARQYARFISTNPGIHATIYLGMYEVSEVPLVPYEIWRRGSNECPAR